MTQPDATPSAPRAARPVTPTAIAIGLLIVVAIGGTLIVPIYARITPKIGDFPFFYFYLLAYMPFVAIVLGLAGLLQRRLAAPANGSGDNAEVTR
jgi:Protein of unknown function (DUF3311)